MEKINNRLDKAKKRFSELEVGAEENIQNVEEKKCGKYRIEDKRHRAYSEKVQDTYNWSPKRKEGKRMGQEPFLKRQWLRIFQNLQKTLSPIFKDLYEPRQDK